MSLCIKAKKEDCPKEKPEKKRQAYIFLYKKGGSKKNKKIKKSVKQCPYM